MDTFRQSKKVLVVAYFFPPLSGSGVQRTAKFVKYLRAFGWEPTVLTVQTNPSGPDLTDPKMVGEIPEATRIIRIPINATISSARIDRLCSYYQEFCSPDLFRQLTHLCKSRQDGDISSILMPDPYLLWVDNVLMQSDKLDLNSYDCIFSTSGPSSDHILAYFLKKRSGKPWIADFRDEWSNNPLMAKCDRNSLGYRALRQFEKAVVEFCDGMTVISDQMKENYCSGFQVPGNKVKTITNGYDEADFSSVGDLTADGEKFVIVHNGVIYKGREPFQFINAIGDLIKHGKIDRDGIRVYLGKPYYGTPDWPYLQYINAKGLGDIIVFDYLDHENSIRRAAKASLLLLMTGQGNQWKGVFTGKVFEYLRFCKPILNLGSRSSLAANLIRELDRGVTVSMNDQQTIAQTILSHYELWESGKLPQYGITERIKEFERKRLTECLADFLNGYLQVSAPESTDFLQKEFQEALNAKDFEKMQAFLQIYRERHSENSEFVSMQSVIFEAMGNYDLALSCLKTGIASQDDIVDLLFNVGVIYTERSEYHKAFVFFTVICFLYGENALKDDVAAYLNHLTPSCPYSELSLSQTKLFYWNWIRRNSRIQGIGKDDVETVFESLYELTQISLKCTHVPFEIRRDAIHLVYSVIKYISSFADERLERKNLLEAVILAFSGLENDLCVGFRIKVAVCGTGSDTILMCNILSPDSVDVKAFLSDRSNQRQIRNIPVIPPDSVKPEDFDCFVAASSDIPFPLRKGSAEILDYEAFWKLIFSHPHNWSAYLNAMDSLGESQGLILGISYAMRDLDPACFRKKLCSLAASGQDLFYDYLLLNEVLSKTDHLSYCVIGLAKYTALNTICP